LALRDRAVERALAYGLGHVPDDREVCAIAEGWRPFRTWVSVLLVSEHFDAARRMTAARAG
jgi:hypothetical protein